MFVNKNLAASYISPKITILISQGVIRLKTLPTVESKFTTGLSHHSSEPTRKFAPLGVGLPKPSVKLSLTDFFF